MNRFGEVGGLDILCCFEVGDGSGHLQDSGVGAGTQSEFVDGQLQEFLALFIDLAESLNMPIGHLGIAVDFHPIEPLELYPPGGIDPF